MGYPAPRTKPMVWSSGTAPTVNEDSVSGYFAGDLWVDTSGPTLYGCESAGTSGDATWTDLGQSGGGVPDPIVPADGDQGITGDLTVSGDIAATNIVATGMSTADGFKGTTTAMSDGATVTIDFDDGDYHTVTLGGDRTIDASNLEAGRCLNIKFLQDGTGTRVATFAAKFKFPNGINFVTSTGAGDEDVLTFVTFDASSLYAVGQPDFS